MVRSNAPDSGSNAGDVFSDLNEIRSQNVVCNMNPPPDEPLLMTATSIRGVSTAELFHRLAVLEDL